MITLNKEECEAIYELIDQLSGGNPEHSFAWDGSDSLEDATTSACYKIYKALNRNYPEHLDE